MSEKRVAPRHQINHEFRSVTEFIREYALNVSLGGCFIKTDDVVPVGSEVSLKFTVIVDDFETIEGIGKVVRVVPPGGDEAAGVGVVFVSLTDASRDMLVRLFLRDREKKPRQ
ncbi:MAG: PilZ domain-containing protein [Deltaproteobacteria bacterium]|nr:PilZ domain-containing protein [Deltaproteobacteria bacterium]